VKTWLLFLVPPVAGAIIGFVTNVVAIRMLFRPLREIRVFGIRVPFTPGILPRQRRRLAQSIGAMVERELLTPEILRERLARKDVREKIKEALSLFTEKFFKKSSSECLGELLDELPQGREKFLSEKITAAAEKVYPLFASAFMDFIRRDEIKIELEAKGRVFLRNIFLKLNTFQRIFLSAGQYDITLEEKMPEIIGELVSGAKETLSSGRVKKILVEAVSSSLSGIINAENAKIGELLDINEDAKKKLDDFLFEKIMSTADSQIENVLASIDIKTLVSDRIDSLDMLRVERIIMDVMADQFKWIDIFGGILGFFIGLFQSVFSWLVR
jgi:uncharacterized membrane protein YheB (UPF0754 family)